MDVCYRLSACVMPRVLPGPGIPSPIIFVQSCHELGQEILQPYHVPCCEVLRRRYTHLWYGDICRRSPEIGVQSMFQGEEEGVGRYPVVLSTHMCSQFIESTPKSHS